MTQPAPPDPSDEWVAALKALIAPGLYGADLRGSCLLDHPAVLAHTGDGADEQVRVGALITVLEEAADGHLRANDKIAVRMLLGLGEWSGRPATDRRRSVAKLRNRHWSWERNYRKEPLRRDLNMIVLALDRSVPAPGRGLAQKETARPDRITALSDDLVRALGRLRTAYPLDMTLEQMAGAELFVETRLVRYHERGRRGPELTLDAVVRSLSEGRSVLLLGEPGAGKSVALYEVVRRSIRMGLLPFPTRAREHTDMLSRSEWPDLSALTEAVLFLDGLDEAVANRAELAQNLKKLLRRRPTLVTSRLRQYEHELSPLLADAGFDEVFVLLPWRPDIEFHDFLGRLHGAGLLDEPTLLYDEVAARTDLANLVKRPLFARMLTFIGEPASLNVADPVTLYGEYLTRLSRVAEVSADPGGGALPVWQAAAWAAHSSGILARDAIALSDLTDALPHVLAPRHGRRILDLILDVRTVRNREVGEFLHYSFFEYLVAAHVCDTLLARPDAPSIHELFRHDLTREIRHHLIAQLRATPVRNLRERLTDAYRTVRSAGTTPEGRAVCNLLVYLLSRTAPQSEKVLVELLETEDDPFLSAAILWALCHRGIPGADMAFFERLDQDPGFRSLCRGYVLYYYGDMERDEGPPYVDEPPFRSCSNTLRTIMDVFERSNSIEKVSARRRAIDLYTFLDLLVVRNITLSRESLDRLRILHRSLQDEKVDARLCNHLAEMMDLLKPP